MYKTALVGLGNIAWKYDKRMAEKGAAKTQAAAMLAHPELETPGGCSINADDRHMFAAWLPGASVFADLADMLAALAPDIVGICSPTALHFEHAMQCLEAGVKGLWLEKPPTDTLQHLDDLIAAATAAKATVLVNYTRRYLPAYERLREVFRQERHGPCRLIRIVYSPGLARNGVHLLDQLFYLTQADGYDLEWVEKTPGNSPGFSLRLSNGLLVQASGMDVPYHTNDISLVCDRGVVSILRGGKIAQVERSDENKLFPGFYDLHDAEDDRFVPIAFEGYMDAALADLVECMKNGTKPRSSLESARLSQSLLDDILERAKA